MFFSITQNYLPMDRDSIEDSFEDEELRIAPMTADGEILPSAASDYHFDRIYEGRRQTFSGNSTSIEEFEASTLEYFTPDSTMSKSNAYFLDKMKAALGECASSDNTYETAFDSTINRTNSIRVDRNRRSSLPKLQEKTFIGDRETMPFFDVDRTPRNGDKHQHFVKYVEEENISDNELDNDFLRYQGTQIKYEDITVEDVDDVDIQDDPYIRHQEKSDDYREESLEHGVDVQYDQEDNKYEYLQKYQQSDEEYQDDDESDEDIHHTNLQKDEYLQQYQEYQHNDGEFQKKDKQHYNDLEEDGYEYLSKYQENNQGIHNTTEENQENMSTHTRDEQPSSVYSMQSSKNYEYEVTLSEQGYFKQPDVKCSGIPRKKYFVTPPKNVLRPKNDISTSKLPQRKFFTTPTKNNLLRQQENKKTPSSLDKFKYVQSPVGIYIKNSKTSAICRNVHASKLPDVLPASFFDDIPDISHRWEFDIPEVVYRPSGIQHQLRPREIHLPENIQVLMPMVANMVITKHETRIPGREMNSDNIRRKLHEDVDLTMSCSVMDDGPQDISILQVKPYI